jgi:hypothetical protein
MQRTSFILLLAVIVYCAGAPANAAAPVGKCTSIQAQCAVEMGGQCNPNTGFWCYGFYRGRNCGGTNMGGAYDQCVSRKLREQKTQSR